MLDGIKCPNLIRDHVVGYTLRTKRQNFMKAKPYESITTLSSREVEQVLTLPRRQIRLWEREKGTCFTGSTKEKFYNRWGIELGLLENIFRWDRGVTMTLIEQGISPEVLVERAGTSSEEAELNVATIASHVNTLKEFEMGFVKGEIELSASFIRQLQEQLLHNQKTHDVFVPGQGYAKRDLTKGVFKETPNDPFDRNPPHDKINSYCPPEETGGEVIRLCDLYRSAEIQNASPEVRAAWLHHRFTQIHPFVDGNGRVARTLASLVLLKAGLPPLIVRRDEDRSMYLDALADADNDNLKPLVDIFIERVRTEILHLVVDSATVPEALEVARRTLLERVELRRERAAQLFPYLHAHAKNKFSSLSSDIQKILYQGSGNRERFMVEDTIIKNPSDDTAHSYDDVVESRKFGYKARLTDISAYICFSIVTDYRFSLVIHLHERDPAEGGGFVIVAIMIEEELDGEGSQTISKVPIDPFFISVEKSADNQIHNEILQWAARAVEQGISVWGRSL